MWIEKHRDAVLAYKSVIEAPPPGSGLPSDLYLVILMTDWQKKVAERRARFIIHIDGTHNVTQYKNLNLFTLLVVDEWGHGTLPSI